MGAGAARLASDRELRHGIEAAGWSPTVEVVPPVEERLAEIARVFALAGGLAASVRGAIADGAFPLVLAGNCASSLGTVAGLGADELGVVWFDAHADLDTPEDNLSGFFDVMALAVLTGSGWLALRETVPGFRAIAEAEVVLAGVRDLAPYQLVHLERSAIRAVPGAIDPDALRGALEEIRAPRVYLHVDLDVLDSGEGSANEYAAPGGPGLERLLEGVEQVFGRFEVAAAALTAYDPDFDTDGRVAAAARRLAALVAERALAQR